MLPCEYSVKFKIPLIKAKLAKTLKAKNYSNKEIAKILNVTEAAVSQYLNGKRAVLKVKKNIQIQKNKQICNYCKFCKFTNG
ncbi:MAG: helix-turn-helix domain-containing protein [Candidatus Nanoarchaeia archaeon]